MRLRTGMRVVAPFTLLDSEGHEQFELRVGRLTFNGTKVWERNGGWCYVALAVTGGYEQMIHASEITIAPLSRVPVASMPKRIYRRRAVVGLRARQLIRVNRTIIETARQPARWTPQRPEGMTTL